MARSRTLAPVLLAAGLLLAAACGGDGGGEPTPSPTVTDTPPMPTRTPEPTALPTPEPQASAQPEARCPDPYPGGAPFEPTPGSPIRLRPSSAPPALTRYQPIPFTVDRELEDMIEEAIGDDDQQIAVVVKDLDSGSGVSMNAGRVFYGASLYKTWVLLELYHHHEAGLIDFGETFIVSDYYVGLGLNQGELAPCSEVSLAQAMGRMMSFSDNVAANALLDRVGAGNTNRAIRVLGLPASGFVDGSLPTTAQDMALLLEAIATGRAVSAEASAAMLLLMGSEAVDDRIPALLPPGTRVAHKTGSWEDATHDAGVVFAPEATYVIVVLTDAGYTDQDSRGRIARISKTVYDYYAGG